METNWILVIAAVAAAAISLVVFFVHRDQKDKKELMQKLIKEDEVLKPAEHETENEQED